MFWNNDYKNFLKFQNGINEYLNFRINVYQKNWNLKTGITTTIIYPKLFSGVEGVWGGLPSSGRKPTKCNPALEPKKFRGAFGVAINPISCI